MKTGEKYAAVACSPIGDLETGEVPYPECRLYEVEGVSIRAYRGSGGVMFEVSECLIREAENEAR